MKSSKYSRGNMLSSAAKCGHTVILSYLKYFMFQKSTTGGFGANLLVIKYTKYCIITHIDYLCWKISANN